MLYIYVSHVEGIYVWGGVMARLHHDGNEIKDLFIFKIKFLYVYIYMYMYINNTILACNRYLPKRKKKKKKDRSFPCTFSLFTKRRITGYEMVDLA